MKKDKKAILIINIVLLIMFNVLFWGIPFPKKAASWVVYGFSMVAFVASMGIIDYSFRDGKVLTSKLYRFPIFKLGIFYVITQLTISLIVCILGSFIVIPASIVVVINVLIMGFVIIGIVAADAIADNLVMQDEKLAQNLKNFVEFRISIGSIVDSCKDDVVKGKLRKLEERFKYSDPISSENLYEIEEKIRKLLDELEQKINIQDNSVIDSIDEISRLLDKRNRMCKELKN